MTRLGIKLRAVSFVEVGRMEANPVLPAHEGNASQ
jgi:hypothetical protein